MWNRFLRWWKITWWMSDYTILKRYYLGFKGHATDRSGAIIGTQGLFDPTTGKSRPLRWKPKYPE